MNYKFHVTVGVLASIGINHLIIQENTDLAEKIIFSGATALGSLLPDIDNAEAKLPRLFPHLSRFIRSYFFTIGAYWYNDGYMCSLAEHRGICHSFTACLVSVFPFLILRAIGLHVLLPGWGIMLGMLLHIIADSLTPIGSMLLAPFSTKRYFTNQRRYWSATRCSKTTPIKKIYFVLLYFCNLTACFFKSFYALVSVVAVTIILNLIIGIRDKDMFQFCLIVGISLICSIALHIALCFSREQLFQKLNARAQRKSSKKAKMPDTPLSDVEEADSNIIGFSNNQEEHN